MPSHPALRTMEAALGRLLPLPSGELEFWSADSAATLPQAPSRCEQGFRPDVDALSARDWSAQSGVEGIGAGFPAAPSPTVILVLLPRSREVGRGLLARGVARLEAGGGLLLAAAHNDEGARSFEKDLALLVPLSGSLSKHHGRAFWVRMAPGAGAFDKALAEAWLAADAPRRDATTGLWQRPGVFNEGRLDAGSALLIEHLPKDLRGRVADLGAGSGLLSLAVLERCPAVTALELFEAEARAVDLARRNLAGARVPVGIHWHDVSAGVLSDGRARFDAVVCNPPFHAGSRSVPALGRAFIAAAARALAKDGQLLLVANRHLPYEDELRTVFGRGELLAEQGGFKVYRAWEPKP
jgi:16S rRNA (guanine1207-N2)-methyltransferase